MMRAKDFLTTANSILDERGREYDRPGGERSMPATCIAFNAITGKNLTLAEGYLFLQIVKDVRQWSRPGIHLDSAIDAISYAALKSEALMESADKKS